MIKHLDDFLCHTTEILKKYKGANNFSISINYLLENCFRSYDLLVAIDHLSKSPLKQQDLEHSYGILLRSGLYDFIYSQYLMHKCISNDQLDSKSFELEVREHMNGHYNKIDSDLELIDQLKDLDKFKDYKSKKKFKVLGILKEGRSFAKEKKLNYLDQAIENWEWYSKYEHYGVFTNHMYKKLADNELRVNYSVNLLYLNIFYSLLTVMELDFEMFNLEDVLEMGNIALREND